GNLGSRNRDGRSFGMARRNWRSRSWPTGNRPPFRSRNGPCGSGLCNQAPTTLSRTIPMRNKHPRMKLSLEEEIYLRHWMYDEIHYGEVRGAAKGWRVEHGVVPGALAAVIAAVFPAPADQQAAGLGPPPAAPPTWPWSGETLRMRLAEARA